MREQATSWIRASILHISVSPWSAATPRGQEMLRTGSHFHCHVALCKLLTFPCVYISTGTWAIRHVYFIHYSLFHFVLFCYIQKNNALFIIYHSADCVKFTPSRGFQWMSIIHYTAKRGKRVNSLIPLFTVYIARIKLKLSKHDMIRDLTSMWKQVISIYIPFRKKKITPL